MIEMYSKLININKEILIRQWDTFGLGADGGLSALLPLLYNTGFPFLSGSPL